MIHGVVGANEARVRLRVLGPSGQARVITAVIDTGYTGWLTLPAVTVKALKLSWQDTVPGILADGSETLFDVYEATVIWDRRPRLIRVNETDAIPLIGMALMKGYELNVQVRSRGKVTIKRLRY